MKWIRRVAAVIAVLVVGLLLALYLTSIRTSKPVGFQMVQATSEDGTPFVVGVWYPTTARAWPSLKGLVLMDVAQDAAIAGSRLPLVVISHGNGGGSLGHAGLAMELASAGYVVAALTHAGDNFSDQSAMGKASFFSGRTRQLRATVDHMLGNWQGRDRIDAQRIGAFGFSMGGWTVLAAAGVQPDLRRIAQHCGTSRETACEVLRQAKSPLLDPVTLTLGGAIVPDPRIKAAVVAAPGFGFTMGPAAWAAPGVPLQVWIAERDEHVPYASNGKLMGEARGTVAVHTVAGAGHFSFITPCHLLAPPLPICTDADAFDRKAFHKSMNAGVLAYFNKHLAADANQLVHQFR